MKRIFLSSALMLVLALTTVTGTRAAAPDDDDYYAEIKFDTLVINMGTFTSKEPKRSCTFNFTNNGTAPLIVNQVHPSCGCTVATYTETPVQPGESGVVEVTYNSKGQYPGRFKKSISVRTNSRKEMTRLIIEGEVAASSSK
ncbi:MAG: DUF1573 domain-containing protein [Prevotellaceae bacterium]|nr:DUF1573 domain-containing protein [Prevotellaceae bacterium]